MRTDPAPWYSCTLGTTHAAMQLDLIDLTQANEPTLLSTVAEVASDSRMALWTTPRPGLHHEWVPVKPTLDGLAKCRGSVSYFLPHVGDGVSSTLVQL